MFPIALVVFLIITQGAVLADGMSIMRKTVKDYRFEVDLILLNISRRPSIAFATYGSGVIIDSNTVWTTKTVIERLYSKPPNAEIGLGVYNFIKNKKEKNGDFRIIAGNYKSIENPEVFKIVFAPSRSSTLEYPPIQFLDSYSTARTGYINLPSKKFFANLLGYERELTNLRYSDHTIIGKEMSKNDAFQTCSLTNGLNVIGLRINETHFAKVKKEMSFDPTNLWPQTVPVYGRSTAPERLPPPPYEHPPIYLETTEPQSELPSSYTNSD